MKKRVIIGRTLNKFRRTIQLRNDNVGKKQNSITRINRTNLQRKYRVGATRSFDELKRPSDRTSDPRCQLL